MLNVLQRNSSSRSLQWLLNLPLLIGVCSNVSVFIYTSLALSLTLTVTPAKGGRRQRAEGRESAASILPVCSAPVLLISHYTAVITELLLPLLPPLSQ